MVGGTGRDVFQMRVSFIDDAEPYPDAQGGGSDLILDFARGQDQLRVFQVDADGERAPLKLADLDSNHNGRVDGGDAAADLVAVTSDGVTKSSLLIDVTKVPAITIGGEWNSSGNYGEFIANVRLYGVTELTSADLAAS